MMVPDPDQEGGWIEGRAPRQSGLVSDATMIGLLTGVRRSE